MNNIAFIQNLLKKGFQDDEQEPNTRPAYAPVAAGLPDIGDPALLGPTLNPDRFRGLAPAAEAPAPALPQIAPVAKAPDWDSMTPAQKQAAMSDPKSEYYLSDYYPDGTPKRAMDERFPDGRSIMDAVSGKAATAPAASSLPTIGGSPAEQKLAEVNARDYTKPVWRNIATGEETSKRKKAEKWGNQAEVVVAEGKDRNKKWSIWEKIGAGLAGWATGGLVGGIKAGTDRNYFQKVRDQREREDLLPKIAQQQQIEKHNVGIANTVEDNQINRERIRSANREKAATRRAQREKEFYRTFPSFDPAKATPAQKAWLEELDLTPEMVGKYDLKDPKTKRIGDTEFTYDRNAQAWVDSGMPKDATKAVTEVTAIDPSTGKSYTFVTTQEKAAGMMNARTVAGLQIQAAKDRQLSQQGFTAGENQKDRVFRSEIESAKMKYGLAMKQFDQANGRQKTLATERAKYVAAYTKQNGMPPSEADISSYLEAVVQVLDNPE